MNGDANTDRAGGSFEPVSATALAPDGKEPHPHHLHPLHEPSLDQMLVESGLLSEREAAEAREVARREGLGLERVLVRDGLILSRDLGALLALHLSIPMVDLGSQTIDDEALRLFPEDVARKYLVLPVKSEGGGLTVAMPNPLDFAARHDLTVLTGSAIEPLIATPEDILEHIDIAYRLTEGLTEGPSGSEAVTSEKVTAKVLRTSAPAQVIDLLLHQALQDRASDIHVVPTEVRLRIRFRIDGILHDVMDLPLEMQPSLVSRLKIMSGMNIAERRRSQDGQFTVDVQNRAVDVRVAISKTVSGEMAVLRLLDKGFTLLGLDRVGMSPESLAGYRRLLRLPYGIIIVCGPTGAGKSTTLYASILEMNRTEQNVISLEDPVEYRIPDTNQMQIHSEAGITFATQLRSILRLDPDVILVGEIRDEETAVIATQAALTGHTVLTSLHANDAVSALIRLKDLGVAPYLIASSVAGVVSQRMVRVVCGGCKAAAPAPLAEREAYAAETGDTLDQYTRGAGCNLCAQTGYRGRTGVFEVLTISDALRQLLLADSTRNQLREQALAEGMTPLQREGMLKVKQGLTTPYEVMRVLFSLE